MTTNNIQRGKKIVDLGLIPFRGDLVSWEFYKDFHGIEEFGYIGDAINGTIVHSPKYRFYLEKELAKRI